MSLISCPECNQEVSDTVENCIKCGFSLKPIAPISNTKSKADKPKIESIVTKAVDFIFAMIYILLGYELFFGDELGKDMNGIGAVIGIIIGIAIIYFIQKLLKAVLGTIARSFDSAFNNS